MNNQNGPESGRFIWRLGDVNMDVQQLPQRLMREHSLQEHVGEVVRGVIPGAGAQHQYHPNPYLQHLYRQRQGTGTAPGSAATDEGSVVVNLDPGEQDNARTGAGPADVALNMQQVLQGHTHTHAHEQDGERGENSEGFDMKMVMSSGAFAILLFLHLMADHILGILIFVGLVCLLTYANKQMIEIVHLSSLRERESRCQVLRRCCQLIVFLSLHISFMYWMFREEELWRVLYFQLPLGWKGDIFDLLWVTMVTDYIIKSAAVILKSFLSALPNFCLAQKKKGKYFMFVEVLTQTYRCVLPIVPWIHFLFDQPKSGRLVFAGILVCIYVILKLCGVGCKAVELKKAFRQLLTDTNYGVKPNKEDLASRDENCPICQDEYQDPVMLSCKHIFCENCVSVWFDREKTCPMCRTQIQADRPTWQDGSTSQHLQWY